MDFMCTLLATNISRKQSGMCWRWWFVRTLPVFFGGICMYNRSPQGSRSFRKSFPRSPSTRSKITWRGRGQTLPDVTQLLAAHTMWKTFSFEKVGCFTKMTARWAPASCKWSYNPSYRSYKPSYNWYLVGGGNSNIFYVHPENLGKMNPFLTSIFFKGVGSTTN